MESNLSFVEIFVRYYLLIAITVIAGFSGFPILAILALPVFLSAITGYCPIKSFLGYK